ncbi:hypothetical protein AC579_2749 [Pseudocercospora musae]|nr:hypothetical protein AC579_2749 [Pseudocercospora musae]
MMSKNSVGKFDDISGSTVFGLCCFLRGHHEMTSICLRLEQRYTSNPASLSLNILCWPGLFLNQQSAICSEAEQMTRRISLGQSFAETRDEAVRSRL